MKLEKLDRAEALRYLGYKGNEPDENVSAIVDECEKLLLDELEPKYVYRVFDIEHCPVTLSGNDINEHIRGCTRIVLLAATLGTKADGIIRRFEVDDMVRAVILDALAGVAIEQVCNRAETEIKAKTAARYMTWRFSAGYGDFPIETQSMFISALNAEKRIGLTVNSSSIMIPRKSVTAVIGLSETEFKTKKRGCESCNFRDKCGFRAKGEHCGI